MSLFINSILSATLFTLGVSTVNVFTNVKKSIFYYCLLYLGIFAASYVSPMVGEILFPKAHATGIEITFWDNDFDEYYVPNAQDEIDLLNKLIRKLTPEQQKEYKKKSDFHLREADRCYKEAQKLCWYLPDRDDRDTADNCFKYAVSLLLPGTPLAKAAGFVLILAGDYALDCINEWRKIETKLREAQYHYEMYEHYLNIQLKG